MEQEHINFGANVINNNETHPHLNNYFEGKPGKVVGLRKGPDYAGGEFITVKLWYGTEQSFYKNALKKL